MHVSPFQPCSSIFLTPKAIPALIFLASKPGVREGSEKSTVSGFWPTNRILVIWFLHSGGVDRKFAKRCSSCEVAPQEFAGDIERLARGPQENKIGGEDVHHAL